MNHGNKNIKSKNNLDKSRITKDTKPAKYNLFVRTVIYSILIILISLMWYFGDVPIISNYLHDIENKTYDLLFIARNNLKLNPQIPKNIVIVGIDASSINKVGVPWPWPRQFHAALIDMLAKAKAKYIVFDIIFDTISPLSLQTQDILGKDTIAKTTFDSGRQDDEFLAMSISNAMNIFLACEAEPLSKTTYQPVYPITTYFNAIKNDTSFLGNTSVTYDRDNFVRKAKLIYPEFQDDPALSVSTALRVGQKYLNKKAKIHQDYTIELGDKKIPYKILINFYGPSETITTIPYWKALESAYKGQGEIFKDKIILIGRTKLKASIDPYKSVRSPDAFPTPYAALTPNFSGVEIQATILANILENKYITRLSDNLSSILILIVAFIGSILVASLRTRLVLCFYACLIYSFLYIALAFVFLTFFRISIPPSFPTYGIILPIYFINFLDQYFFIDRTRRRQARIFRQMVPAQIADEIERMDQEQLALGGIKREITILFADIKNFTGHCEKHEPDVIVNILNKFFTEMVMVIHEHNGLVDKFIGDAIMAIWGSPKVLEKKTQADLAVKCALAMKKELSELNKIWERMGLIEKLNIRIGVNTAEAVTGNVGSPERMQFSAIGDGVNVASRLEAVNKVYETDILISDNTATLLTDEFHLREIDTVLVPGRDNPINIFEIFNEEQYNKNLCDKYLLGLNAYRNKDFDEAIKNWEECTNLDKNDGPSKIMLERALKLKQQSLISMLPDNWKAIWEIENK